LTVGRNRSSDRLLLTLKQFVGATARAEPEQQPSPRDLLESCRHNCEHTGMVICDVQDQRAHRDVGYGHRDRGQGSPTLEHVISAEHTTVEMIGYPDPREAGVRRCDRRVAYLDPACVEWIESEIGLQAHTMTG
jgi:hypothetical protein